MNQQQHIAVLTGDIVNSSNLSDDQLVSLRTKLESFSSPAVVLPPGFYRGDSFQLAASPLQSLVVALQLRMTAKAHSSATDLRVAIGLGNMENNPGNALLANGSAFIRSGKNLDTLKGKNLRLIIVCAHEELNRELETYCYLADALLSKLTPAQATVTQLRLKGWSQQDIARELGISQGAVSKALKASHWRAVKKFVERFEHLINTRHGIYE